jgi:hypothetical protein
MYVFNNIKLLLALADTGLLKNSQAAIYVTEMVLESNNYDYVIKEKLKKLVDEGSVIVFSLGNDFFKFAIKEEIKYNRLDVMAFACVFFAKRENYFLVTSNETIKKCAEDNGVSKPPIKDILMNILKEEKYVEFILNT